MSSALSKLHSTDHSVIGDKLTTLAICWPRFGPYHLARIDACAKAFRGEISVVGIETSPTESVYAWPDTPIEDRSWTHLKAGDKINIGQLLTRLSPDVVTVNGWGFSDSRRVLRWAIQNKRGIILFSDSRPGDHPIRCHTEWIKRRLVPLCESAVVAGQAHADYLTSLGLASSRIFVGLDVVDNHHFASGKQFARPVAVEKLLGKSPYLLSISRFVEKKNLHRLIDAFSLAVPNLLDQSTKLLFVGDGELKDSLIRHVHHNQLQNKVAFLPFQHYENLPAIYGNATAFVLPSTMDQWGLVVNEAMAAGCPVAVSNRCGCAAELIVPGYNGEQFDPLDIHSIAESLLRLLNADNLRLDSLKTNAEITIMNWGVDRFANAVRSAIGVATGTRKPEKFTDKIFLNALGIVP